MQRFFDLAAERAAVVEEVALHQLLRQRRAALLDLPGAHVHPRRAHDGAEVDAVMRVELAIFDDLERRRQQRRAPSSGVTTTRSSP